MRDKIFVDSNILIYAISKNSKKCDIARQILIENADLIIISSQVINEFINVCIKKKILSERLTFKYATDFMDVFDFCIIEKKDIKLAMYIKERYRFSYWDSLIVASALENGCSVLYTEDMQDGQVIEKRLKIINPFK
ncbi:MAG: PIN domain-containing protein [Thermodesulfobacteria bacterium]|nr:PIN domain-containing protein [Thermodesulfobacteriota bacterium]